MPLVLNPLHVIRRLKWVNLVIKLYHQHQNVSIEGVPNFVLDLPIHVLRPFLGARVLKTGLAVFTAILLFHWIDPRFAVTAGIPAFLAVQPSIVRSGRTVRDQMTGNVMGAIVAMALGYWLGPNPVTMALGVVFVIVLLPRIGLMDSVVQSVVMVLVVLDQHHDDFAMYSALRIGSVFGGTLVGYLINRFVLPPDFGKPAREAMLAAWEHVGRFAGHVREALAFPSYYQQEQVAHEIEAVHEQLGRARLYLDLLREDKGMKEAGWTAMESAVSGLGVFVERLSDILEAVRQVGGLSGEERTIVAAAITGTTAFMSESLAHLLQGKALSPDAEAVATAAADRLQEVVLRLIETEEQRSLALHLHTVLSNIHHMLRRAEKMEQLVRRGEEVHATV